MKKVLIIGFMWPEPTATAAGQRMLQLVRAFLDFGCRTTFASTASRTEHSADLGSLGVQTVPIVLNHASFDDFVRKLNPDLVVFDRFMVEEQFGWRVAEQVPGALRILNTEDLHSLRKIREACHKIGEGASLEKWLAHDRTKREIASIYRSDLTLVISTFEMELLTKKLKIPGEILLHLPFMLDGLTMARMAPWPLFGERRDFVVCGNGRHAPNVDSIKCLKEMIWPMVRKKLPMANLNVYGAYLPRQIKEMHAPREGFYVLGWAKDLDAVLQKVRVCLAPLRFGSGIKGKLVQALQNGTPCVTTAIGSEGMYRGMHWPGAIADGPTGFAVAAAHLYSNEKTWSDAQKKGIRLINRFYAKTPLRNKLQSKISELLKNLEQHRSQNFIGSLLHHHSMASTKYLAKWIAEKNRNRHQLYKFPKNQK